MSSAVVAILNALGSPAGQAAVGGAVKLITIILHKDGGATVIDFMDEGDKAIDEAVKIATEWKKSKQLT